MATIRQLQYLIAIDEERHFGKAAAKVHVSQPTLSTQISKLEGQLGLQLFERDRGGVFPTPQAHEIIQKARHIVKEVREMEDFAKKILDPLSGQLRLGVPATLGPYVLPHIVPQMHARFPNLKLFVQDGAPRDIQKMVETGYLDFALSPLPIISTRLDHEEIFAEPIKVGMAWDHPLVRKPVLQGSDLQGLAILALQSGHHFYDQVNDLCARYGAKLLNDYEGSSLDALRHMVVMGAGISFFPELYIKSEVTSRTDLVVRAIEGHKLERNIVALWRKESFFSREFIKLARLIKKVTADIL